MMYARCVAEARCESARLLIPLRLFTHNSMERNTSEVQITVKAETYNVVSPWNGKIYADRRANCESILTPKVHTANMSLANVNDSSFGDLAARRGMNSTLTQYFVWKEPEHHMPFTLCKGSIWKSHALRATCRLCP